MTQKIHEYGAILLVFYPFTDQSFAKIRPTVVVSRQEFNLSGDIVVVPLTSKLRGNEYEIEVLDTHAEWARTKLKRPSAIKWTKPITIATSVVSGPLGTMPDDIMLTLSTKLQSLFAHPTLYSNGS